VHLEQQHDVAHPDFVAVVQLFPTFQLLSGDVRPVPAPQVFQEVKRKITENVRQMTGLEVVEVKMFVDDVDVEGDRKLGEEPETQETTGRLE